MARWRSSDLVEASVMLVIRDRHGTPCEVADGLGPFRMIGDCWQGAMGCRTVVPEYHYALQVLFGEG